MPVGLSFPERFRGLTTRGLMNVLMKTYIKVDNVPNDRHPPEGGGRLKSFRYMDSRLRGNDAHNEPIVKTNYEICSMSMRFFGDGIL